MKRIAVIIICLLFGGTATAQIIDRMLAVVNNHVITLSDVRREREIRAVLGDTTTKDDKTILNEMIDSQLIEEQSFQFPGIEAADERLSERMSTISNLRGLQRTVVEEAIRRRLRAAEFFELRFRQFLGASDEELQQYYRTYFVPEAQRRGVNPVPPLETVTDLVRQNVVEEKLQHDISQWLESIRRRSVIEIFE